MTPGVAMGRKSPLLTAALCTSLTVHLLGLSALAWWYVAYTPPERWAAIDRQKILIDAINSPRRPPAALPPKKRPPPPKMQTQKPSEALRDDSGEATGTGTANRSTPGEQPMLARQGYEQADLMRDNPDDSLIDPESLMPAAGGAAEGSVAKKQSVARAGQYTPDFVAESHAITDPDVATPKPAASHKGVGPLPVVEKSDPGAPVPAAAKATVVVAKADAKQTEVPKAVRGHRATASDTESVALAKETSATIRAGKVEGRHGLRVTWKNPSFGLASVHDGEVLGQFRVLIGAQVDTDGNVVNIQILQSSGSTNIDKDYENAAYEATFEPPKDQDGHPIAATWTITCID